jgi:hypothetical protein
MFGKDRGGERMMGHSATAAPRLSKPLLSLDSLVSREQNVELSPATATPSESDKDDEHDSGKMWTLKREASKLIERSLRSTDKELPSQPKRNIEAKKDERTVVMLGLTGHGKSQLIKSMFRIFKYDKEALSVNVGDGSVSTTDKMTCHSMRVAECSTPMLRQRDVQEWKLKYGKKVMEHSDEVKMFAGKERWCADYYIHEYKADIKYSRKSSFTLNMVDVPGGSDSKGSDDWNFYELAKYLTSCGGVTAFVFAVMHKRVFDEDFQRFFRYYWDWLSIYGVPFIMVHTGWDPFMPHYADKITQRQTKFLETFPKAGSVKHIFMDSVWNEEGDEDYDPDVAMHDQQKKAMAVTSINELIQEVLHRRNMPLDQLHFMKTPAMKAFDNLFRTAAETGMSHLADPMKNVDTSLSEVVSTIAELKQRKTDTQLRVDPINHRLQQIDNDTLVQLEEHEAGACYLWGWRTVSITTKYPIAELETTVSTTAQWDHVMKDGCKATGRVSSGACPRFTWGTLIAYATSSTVNSEEIQKLKEQLQPAMRELSAAKKDFERENAMAAQLGHQLEDLTLQLRKQDLVIRVCSWPSMSPKAFAKLFPIYEKAKQGTEVEFADTLWAMRDELTSWETHHEVDTDVECVKKHLRTKLLSPGSSGSFQAAAEGA